MHSNFYSDALDKALTELRDVTKEREQLELRRYQIANRMGELREGVRALAVLAGLDRDKLEADYPDLFANILGEDVGLTEAIKVALKSRRNEWLNPIEIKSVLLHLGVESGKYSNFLAAIHTTLKRLCEGDAGVDKGGSINMGIDEASGKTVYRWESDDSEAPKKPKGGKKRSAKSSLS